MSETRTPEFPVSIGTLSNLTGCSPETIRYYEKQALLPEAARSFGGHRQYTREQLRLLQFILRARELGFSQPDVRKLLFMANPENTDCGKVHDLASHQLGEVRARLRNLHKLEATLSDLVDQCAKGGRDMECPVIDSLLEET